MGSSNLIQMAMDRLSSFWKNSTKAQFLGSILVGFFGSALISVFLTGLIPISGVLRWIPWILGFNAGLTGYTLLDRTRNMLRRKKLAAFGAGFCMSLLFSMLLQGLSRYMTGMDLIMWTDFLFYLLIGTVFGGLGGMLSIKYRTLVQ